MTKEGNQDLSKILSFAILLVFGVLFCCSLAMGVAAISWTVGIFLIVAAILLLISSYIETKSITAYNGIVSAAVGAFGVYFIVDHLAGIIIGYIPYLLIFIGGYLIIDSILYLTVRHGKDNLIFGIELALGAVSLTLGFCLLFIDDFKEYASLMFGIILILIAIQQIIMFIMSKQKGSKSKK